MLAFRDWITAGWDDTGQVDWFQEHGIDLIRGTAGIAGPGMVAISPAGGDGTDRFVSTERIVPPRGDSARGGRGRGAPSRRGSSCGWASTRPRPAWRATTYVLGFADGDEVRGDRILLPPGARCARCIGLEPIGVASGPPGVAVDERMRVAEDVGAIADVTGIVAFAYVGTSHGRIAMVVIPGE